MLNFLTLKPEAFGLDISDRSLKIAFLKKKKGGFSLVSFGEEKLKPGIIEQGEVKDEAGLQKAIGKGLEQVEGEEIKAGYVVASLPEEKTFLEVIKMPKMKDEELSGAVYFEAENHIPLPLDQVYLDFQAVKPLYNHLDHTDVLITALPRKIIDSYVNAIKGAGLKLKALESGAQAIARCLIKNGVAPAPTLIIDIGATKTSFIIFSGYSLRFTSSIPISSEEFTGAIARTLQIDISKAEELKLKYRLKKNTADETEKKIFEALIPIFTDLIEQTKRCIDYYHSHASHEHLPSNGQLVDKIYLCGGGANLFCGLTDFLADELKTPVELADPWANIPNERKKTTETRPPGQSLAFATALGLALRGISENND